jgi:hypothetical protein
MVHTWNQNLKTSQPIEAKPLVIGSGDRTVELQPHPTVALCANMAETPTRPQLLTFQGAER